MYTVMCVFDLHRDDTAEDIFVHQVSPLFTTVYSIACMFGMFKFVLAIAVCTLRWYIAERGWLELGVGIQFHSIVTNECNLSLTPSFLCTCSTRRSLTLFFSMHCYRPLLVLVETYMNVHVGACMSMYIHVHKCSTSHKQ